MTEISPLNCTTATHEKIVVLNRDVRYMLINKLKGLDAINFMEAVNRSEQFGVIEINEDHFFNVVFMKISKNKTIKIKMPYHFACLDSLYIDDQGYLYTQKYCQEECPPIRIFIHPTFTVDAFEMLCFTYKTEAFRCHSRLLPFNCHPYVGNLILVDYFNYKDSIGSVRELNKHEKYLFKDMISQKKVP
ncbi:unnamed protein product [Adineta ricciae]|uniref:Uncharacterized protein n=1 Tax=Adineta ricciae TaxID=249248 RepID=A0A815NXU3_ADIRI|nr:unnamed protein product [Adineta ricciae]CAF1440754.1 unnamed protein product [Adineta ricciae]